MATASQWLAGLSFNQGVGGSIPALVDVSLSKTLSMICLVYLFCILYSSVYLVLLLCFLFYLYLLLML